MIWKYWTWKKRLGYLLGLLLALYLVLPQTRARLHADIQLDEALAMVTGTWCTWLAVEENVLNWPLAIVSCVLYTEVFWRSKLFANSLFEAVLVPVCVVGWYCWAHPGKTKELPVIRTDPRSAFWILSLVTGFTLITFPVLTHYGDPAPFWDGATAVGSVAAQVMLARKYYENWHLWVLIDIIQIPLVIGQHLYPTALLEALWAMMGVAGIIGWNRTLRRQRESLTLADET